MHVQALGSLARDEKRNEEDRDMRIMALADGKMRNGK